MFKRIIAYVATLVLGGLTVWLWPQRSTTVEAFKSWLDGMEQEQLWKLLVLVIVAFLLFVFYDWIDDKLLKRIWFIVPLIVAAIVFGDNIKAFLFSIGPVFTGFPLVPFLVIAVMLITLCWTFSVLHTNSSTIPAGERLQKTKDRLARVGQRLQAMRLKRPVKKGV